MAWTTKKPWEGTGKKRTRERTPNEFEPVKGPDLSPIGVIPEPASPQWGKPDMPTWWLKEWRKHQEKAILQVTSKFKSGKKIVFLDAPTGSGKTAIAEGVRRMLECTAIYTCTTKNLQDQFNRDFPYSSVLKGRSNYLSHTGTGSCKTCGCKPGDWCQSSCPTKMDSGIHYKPCPTDPCPYRDAKLTAANSEVAVVNLPYLLAERNYVPDQAQQFNDRGFIVIDECDTLESGLMSFVEIRVSMDWQQALEIEPPSVKTWEAESNDWLEWCRYVLNKVTTAQKSARYDEEEKEELSGLEQKVKRLRNDMRKPDDMATQWVYTGYEDYPDDALHPIVFKPVTVDEFASQVLFDGDEQVLMMSASIISVDEQVRSLGLDRSEVGSVTVPSTFPPENRPVHIVPVGKMVAKTKSETYPEAGRVIAEILDRHPDEKVLVHTVSYHLADVIETELKKAGVSRSIFKYTHARGRERALEQFRESDEGVLLAPSFERGVDLPGDDCRVQIIAKVPYPYLGDKQVRKRLYSTKGGQLWYRVQTIRQLVQMTGRSVRSADDWAETYILDSKFLQLYKKHRHLFPDWWCEAVSMSGEKKRDILMT